MDTYQKIRVSLLSVVKVPGGMALQDRLLTTSAPLQPNAKKKKKMYLIHLASHSGQHQNSVSGHDYCPGLAVTRHLQMLCV